MPKEKSTPERLEIVNDLDALSKLFTANQFVDQTRRAEKEAITARKQAEEYRDTLMSHLDEYTVYRKEQVARQGALGDMFAEMPPWMSGGKDPDKGDPDDLKGKE